MLKKQTMWLLTMLSLMVVLSAYYMMSPQQMNDDLAFLEKEKETNTMEPAKSKEPKPKEEPKSKEQPQPKDQKKNQTSISTVNEDELFDTLRMQRDDKRSGLKEDYTAVIASNNVDAQTKSEAYKKIEDLQTISQKEQMLETLIRSKGFDDALVSAADDQVRIIVKTEKLSKKEANHIMLLAIEELGNKNIAVQIQGK